MDFAAVTELRYLQRDHEYTYEPTPPEAAGFPQHYLTLGTYEVNNFPRWQSIQRADQYE